MSFINSIFLFATAAAVLPVLFHLVRRMKARTVPFSSLMFLKATPKELIRKRRLQDRLLMAARVAVLALLALAFARPYIPAEEIPLIPQRQNESVVLLIDQSFSMNYGGAMQRARQAAESRLDAAASGDEFAIVAFSDEPQIVAPLETDLALHRTALSAVEPGFRTTDFRVALQRAQDILQEATHNRRLIVLISDFQIGGWAGAQDWKLQAGIEFVPEFVGSTGAENAYVEAFELATRRAAEGQLVRYDARVAAQGDAADREHAATLVVDGQEVERRRLPGRSSASITFQQLISEPGFVQGSLALDADALPDDDRYYFTQRVDSPPSILVVDAPSNSARRDAFFLRSAFEIGQDTRFRYATATDVSSPSLRPHDVVILANRSPAGERERSALVAFVEAGGTLVISCGDAADPESITQLIAGFGMGRIERIVDAREEQGYEAIIGEIESQHPIFAPFSAGTSGAIFQPRFRRYARLIPGDETSVLGRFDSGDVFLAEQTFGGGRVLFYASTLNTSWTDLPLDEMYVPFVYQLAKYGAEGRAEKHTFSIGDPVPFSGEPSTTVEIRDPQSRLFRVTLDSDGRGYFHETHLPGHYAAAYDGEIRQFSVNVDPRESDLTFRDAEEVYAAVVAADDVPTTPRQAAAAVVEVEEKRQKLWRVLLLAAIALFMIETYFANRRTAPAGTGATAVRRTQPGPARSGRDYWKARPGAARGHQTE